MILRDVLVRPGIVDSKRVCALPVATQLFFRNLLHVCDGAGRFEADADRLRTVLYGRVLDRVTRAHVSRWLVECQQAELIDLYTEKDRGYGEVFNYGQRDTKRRVRFPGKTPGHPDELPLTTAGPPPSAPPRSKANRRGVSENGRAAADPHSTLDDDQWLEELARQWAIEHPKVDVRAEFRKAEKRYPLGFGRKFFVEEWLTKAEPKMQLKGKGAAPIEPEPEAWKLYLKDNYEGENWASSAASCTWADMPAGWRAKIYREMQR